MPKNLLLPHPDLTANLPSWKLALRAERKSPGTIKVYSEGVRLFLRWCETAEIPPEFTKANVQGYIADLLDRGQEATTATSRLRAVRRYSAWLTEEGEFDTDPLLGVKPPKLDEKPVPKLTDDELRLLLEACAGKDLKDRRDEAIVRFMFETGARASEVITMQTTDIDLSRRMAQLLGKGRRYRPVSFSEHTALAIDRYLRMRRRRNDNEGALWISAGTGRNTFGYPGLYQALGARAQMAGIKGFHPHRLRHTAASRWLLAGGSEGGLMANHGWGSRSMIERYAGDTASERAALEAQGLNLGDL